MTNYLNSLLKPAVKLLEKAVNINQLATELISVHVTIAPHVSRDEASVFIMFEEDTI